MVVNRNREFHFSRAFCESGSKSEFDCTNTFGSDYGKSLKEEAPSLLIDITGSRSCSPHFSENLPHRMSIKSKFFFMTTEVSRTISLIPDA